MVRMIIGAVLVACYTALTGFALVKGGGKNLPTAVMALGCLCNTAYIIIMACGTRLHGFLIGGMALVSAGALLNGLARKDVHVGHHLVRLAVGVVLICLAW